MKKDLSNRNIMMIAVFLLICAGLIFGIGQMRFKILKTRLRELKESRNQIATLSSKKDSLVKLNKNKIGMDEVYKKARNIVPEKKETTAFLSELGTAAAQNQVSIKSIDITEPQPDKKNEDTNNQKKEDKSPYNKLGFNIILNSDFLPQLNFLNTMESLSRFTNITSLTMSIKEDNLIECKINGEIYYKK